MHVHGQNHRNTNFAPVDSEEAGGGFHVIRTLWLFQVICEGQSIGTFASWHKMSRQEECQHYLWKSFGLRESVQRGNFQECQKAGIHVPCLPIAWCITPFKCEIYNMIMLLEKNVCSRSIFLLWLSFFSECMLVMVLALVYKRPLFEAIQTLSLWGYSYV